MSLNIEMQIIERYLFVIPRGKRTSDNISEISKSILDFCLQNNIENVLLDARQLTGRLDISESYLVVLNLFPTIKQFRQLTKVAILESKERYERSRFFERLARKRNYNLRIFEDQMEATTWISKSDEVVLS